MKLQDNPPLHLTYCLNIHPGEAWQECLNAIRTKALVVRDRVSPGKPFGLGMRLSHRAAAELARPDRLNEFGSFLRDNDLYVFTINGFPFGAFHGETVKDRVYGPDWRTLERLDYTVLLAEILAELLPDGLEGSISTVPGSYKPWITGPGDVAAMVENLAACATKFHGIGQRTGKEIILALEPEPDCFLERTDEAVEFLTGPLLREGVPHVRRAMRVNSDEAESMIRRHIGICLDTCHQAVEFEDVPQSLRTLQRADVRVAKVQLSAALRTASSARALQELAAFSDKVYLHQVRARTRQGALRTWRDLPELLVSSQDADLDELRVHFHVPLFFQETGALKSTAPLLTPEFFAMLRAGVSAHLEIETYTFDVLPEALRESDVTTNIAHEYEWLLPRLGFAKS